MSEKLFIATVGDRRTHEDKIPDIIYVDDNYEKYNICEDLAKTLGMNVERKKYGYILRRE